VAGREEGADAREDDAVLCFDNDDDDVVALDADADADADVWVADREDVEVVVPRVVLVLAEVVGR
jgi:hypothetical protein